MRNLVGPKRWRRWVVYVTEELLHPDKVVPLWQRIEELVVEERHVKPKVSRQVRLKLARLRLSLRWLPCPHRR